MLKAVAAVILGYLVLFVIVFLGATIAYLALGPDRAYQPGTYEISTLWTVVMLLIGAVAALAGGLCCRLIARRPRPVVALAFLVLLLGAGQAVFAMTRPEPPSSAAERPADVTIAEAVANSRQPIWTMWANAGIGFIGVLIGGGRKVKAGAERS